jgi:GNAT superfamily N-acetyltransferase
MQIRKATVGDIDLLIRLRINFLGEDTGGLTPAEADAIRESLAGYFARHIAAGTCIALLAEEAGEIIATAYIAVCEKPANHVFVTGVTATLLNIWTHPDYRRRGIATRLIRRLIDEAREAGVSCIDLSASKMGRPVYEKLGFSAPPEYTEMRLKL